MAVAVAAVAASVAGLEAVGMVDLSHGVHRVVPATRSPTTPPVPSPPAAAPPAPVVLAGLSPDAVQPAPQALARRLAPLLSATALGGPRFVSMTVLDARTGVVLYDHGGSTLRAPASVAKLATAAAAVIALGPEQRLVTRALAGAGSRRVVLVGAGDPTLTAGGQRHGAYPHWASLRSLADQVAKALRAAGVASVAVQVDDSAFRGPAVAPTWTPSYVSAGIVAPVQALTVDEGRIRAGRAPRWKDPAVAAGRTFAGLLRARGVRVAGAVRRAVAPAGAQVLGQVSSPPLAALVEHLLSASDDDLAEHLARLAAAAVARPAGFAEASATVTRALPAPAGSPASRLLDGSGLSRGSRTTSAAVAALLARAARADGSDAALWPLLTGLPVAGYSGTLADRFAGATARAHGVVRAKTGTLTGVSALAGEVVDADGRLLVFAVLADRVARTTAGRTQLDRLATTLAGCGCR